MQKRILIVLISDAISCPARRDKERGCGTAVDVEDDIIPAPSDLTRDGDARRQVIANRENLINRIESSQNRRDPILEKNVDARIRQETLERDK